MSGKAKALLARAGLLLCLMLQGRMWTLRLSSREFARDIEEGRDETAVSHIGCEAFGHLHRLLHCLAKLERHKANRNGNVRL